MLKYRPGGSDFGGEGAHVDVIGVVEATLDSELIWLDVVSFDAVVVSFVVVVFVAFDIVVPLVLLANLVEVLWSGVLDAVDSVA